MVHDDAGHGVPGLAVLEPPCLLAAFNLKFTLDERSDRASAS